VTKTLHLTAIIGFTHSQFCVIIWIRTYKFDSTSLKTLENRSITNPKHLKTNR
jgi:hypothetical protein